MKITDEKMNHIARLARLNLTESERKSLGGDLSEIVEYVEKLNELDVSDVPPFAHSSGLPDVSPATEPLNPLDAEGVLGNAPARKGGRFEVPRIIEEAQ